MYLFYSTDISPTANIGEHLILPEQESTHAVRVLRYGAGDSLYVADGQGRLYTCQIINPHPKHCEVEVCAITAQPKHHPVDLCVAVAPTKNIERTEWLIEKCTEIGVDRIVPLLCHYSERKVIRTDRLQKIILSAAKQSLSAYLPIIDEMTPIEQLITQSAAQHKFIAHSSPLADKRYIMDELAQIRSSHPKQNGDDMRTALSEQMSTQAESYCILIGPEGGFSDEEVALAMEHGFVPVSLGESRLRTETAAIVACVLINNACN